MEEMNKLVHVEYEIPDILLPVFNEQIKDYGGDKNQAMFCLLDNYYDEFAYSKTNDEVESFALAFALQLLNKTCKKVRVSFNLPDYLIDSMNAYCDAFYTPAFDLVSRAILFADRVNANFDPHAISKEELENFQEEYEAKTNS